MDKLTIRLTGGDGEEPHLSVGHAAGTTSLFGAIDLAVGVETYAARDWVRNVTIDELREALDYIVAQREARQQVGTEARA